MEDTRNHGLDLLRGLCSVAVAGFHHVAWTYGVGIESIGAFGVYAFFVLSAVTMMLVYAPLFSEGITRLSASGFYRNRAARIFPLLALISVVTFLWLLGRGAPVWGNLQKTILTGTGLFGMGTPGLLSGVTGAWSLGIELVFYAAFPIVAMYSATAPIRNLCIVLATFFVAQHLAMSVLWSFDLINLWYNYAVPLVFAPYFIAGLLIYRLDGDASPRFLYVSLAAIAAVFCFSIVSAADLYRSPFPHACLSVLTVISVWAAYRCELPRKLIPIATFVGEISYALYLVHFLANWAANKILGEGSSTRVFRTVIFAALAILMSYLINAYFEKPMRRSLRQPRNWHIMGCSSSARTESGA